jgi:hypothetical protein
LPGVVGHRLKPRDETLRSNAREVGEAVLKAVAVP